MEWSYETLRMILKEVPSNIFFKDTECRYVFSTHYWRHLQQDGSADWDIAGKTDLDIRKDKENAKLAYEQDLYILKTGKGVNYVIEVVQDGITEYLELIKNPVRNENGEIIGIVGLINNVTEKVMLEKELELYARTDVLTGLYNRRYLDYWIVHSLNTGLYPLCVISADCDGLKAINDTYGHVVGDELIRLTTSLFRVCLPEKTVMCRMGGDEFVLIIPNASKTVCEEYINNMKHMAKGMCIRGEPLSVSFGFCEVTNATLEIMDAIEIADKRMYNDKSENHKSRE